MVPKSAPAATAVVSNGSDDYPDAVPPNPMENSRSSLAAVHAEQEDAFGSGGEADWRLQPHFLPSSLGRASSGNL